MVPITFPKKRMGSSWKGWRSSAQGVSDRLVKLLNRLSSSWCTSVEKNHLKFFSVLWHKYRHLNTVHAVTQQSNLSIGSVWYQMVSPWNSVVPNNGAATGLYEGFYFTYNAKKTISINSYHSVYLKIVKHIFHFIPNNRLNIWDQFPKRFKITFFFGLIFFSKPVSSALLM